MLPLTVQFSRSVVSDSSRPHESQHTRPPYPSQTPGVYSNSCPSSQWCHPANSSSIVPFSSCPQSLPASGSFPMSQLFAWGGQNTALQILIGSSVPFFQTPYICVQIQHLFFSFWLTSLCVTGSRFIRLTRIDSNTCVWLIFHCINIYVLHLLYSFICQWTCRLLPCPGSCE